MKVIIHELPTDHTGAEPTAMGKDLLSVIPPWVVMGSSEKRESLDARVAKTAGL